jgi:glyoxylase I family protein
VTEVVSSSRPERILRLHHFAYRCRDAEETRHFYEDILGMPFTLLVRSERVPSTQEYCPHVHIFFRMDDGSYLAFFDLGDNEKPLPSPNTPAWVNHLALEVDSEESLQKMKTHLEANGIDVLGVVDHGVIDSIYFFDPNGIRLEFAVRTATSAELEPYEEKAHEQLRAWVKEKADRRG